MPILNHNPYSKKKPGQQNAGDRKQENSNWWVQAGSNDGGRGNQQRKQNGKGKHGGKRSGSGRKKKVDATAAAARNDKTQPSIMQSFAPPVIQKGHADQPTTETEDNAPAQDAATMQEDTDGPEEPAMEEPERQAVDNNIRPARDKDKYDLALEDLRRLNAETETGHRFLARNTPGDGSENTPGDGSENGGDDDSGDGGGDDPDDFNLNPDDEGLPEEGGKDNAGSDADADEISKVRRKMSRYKPPADSPLYNHLCELKRCYLTGDLSVPVEQGKHWFLSEADPLLSGALPTPEAFCQQTWTSYVWLPFKQYKP